MRRTTIALAVLALTAVACGGTAATTTTAAVTTTAAPATTAAPTTTGAATTAPTTAATTTTAAPTTTVRIRPDGPDAPDFTLALGEGGSFTLGDEHRPVYLLFWAEW